MQVGRWLNGGVVIVLLAACGGSDGRVADAGSVSDGATKDGAGTWETECSPTGARLLLHGAFESRSTDMKTVPYSGGIGSSVFGVDDVGRQMVLVRDGDISESAFTTTGTFDVSKYPNNVSFVRGQVSGQIFAEGFMALRGTLVVSEIRPVLRVTFHLEDLHENTNVKASLGGAPIAGVVDGCVAAP